MVKQGRVPQVGDREARVILGVASPGNVLHLVEVDRGRQLPLDAPETGRQSHHQDQGRPEPAQPEKHRWQPERWYTPAHFTLWTVALVSLPGQPVQLSSPAVLAPPDDQPVVAAPAAPTIARSGLSLAGLRRWESSAALLLISTVYSLIQGATQNII